MLNFKNFLENLELPKNDIHKIIQYSEKIQSIINQQEDLEDWIKAKLTHAEDYLNTVLDYLKYYKQKNESQLKNKMAIGDLKSINTKAKEIKEILEKENEIKDWVKAKLNLAGEYLDDVFHHLDYNKKEGFVNQSMPDPAEAKSPSAQEISADPYVSIDDLPPTKRNKKSRPAKK